MNRNSKESKRRPQAIPIWNYAQAQKALPYITSVVKSLREHRLQVLSQRSRIDKLLALPGRPTRETLINHQESGRDVERAEERYQEAMDELHRLGIYCEDPIRGQALLPFVHNHLLAWFVFNLFDSVPLNSWRYHSDPEQTQRPVNEIEQTSDMPNLV